MRQKPGTMLLLLALSSFVFAADGLTTIDSSSVSGKISGALPGALSCLTDLKGAIPVIMVLGMAIRMFYQSGSGEGSNATAGLGSIMGFAIIFQAAMNGALCKGNAMYYIIALSMIQMLMQKAVAQQGSMRGIIYLMITMSGFQYILSNPAMMNNPTTLFGYLMGQMILFSILESVGTDASFGFSFINLGKAALEGIKKIRGPKGEDLEKDVEKELKSSLIQIQAYVEKAENEAKNQINNQIKEAKKYGKYEKKVLKLYGQEGKITQTLFSESNEMRKLAGDLKKDIMLISQDAKNIEGFEEELRQSLSNIDSQMSEFVEHATKREDEIFSRDAYHQGSVIKMEAAAAKNMEKKLQEEREVITKGLIQFAKLNVFVDITERLLREINKCTKATTRTLKKRTKLKKKSERKKPKTEKAYKK